MKIIGTVLVPATSIYLKHPTKYMSLANKLSFGQEGPEAVSCSVLRSVGAGRLGYHLASSGSERAS